MALTNSVKAIEVHYNDGSKEVYTPKDWTIMGLRNKSPIPKEDRSQQNELLETRTFQVARRVEN